MVQAHTLAVIGAGMIGSSAARWAAAELGICQWDDTLETSILKHSAGGIQLWMTFPRFFFSPFQALVFLLDPSKSAFVIQ